MTARLKVKDLNRLITCRLCDGYLIEATTLVECLHTFCKGCILKNFESKLCPLCNMDYKKKTHSFRSDPQLQSLVYKMIPNLYTKEIQRRDDFYRSATVRASSSCSDDSVIDKERNLITEDEDLIMQQVGERTKFLSADDLISLSLEYYQIHLDDTDVQTTDRRRLKLNETESTNNNNNTNSSNNNNSDNVQHHKNNGQSSDKSSDREKDGDKRFLSCPAAVSMRHLQKFVRMKYALTADHRVDIIYKGEVLNDSLSLMDVAYIFKWNRTKPMRFFYRIFTPMKVRPIKIVNTTLSTGGKQLQIVPVKPNSDAKTDDVEDAATLSDKEKLFAHLQLQSKAKVQSQEVKKEAEKVKVIPDCVFDYNETEEEEIKKFAESRDREWALQKQLDEKTEYHHISKKRKKNKHSKNDFLHKKRKLHAEKITTDELKLKLKLTNGHKHKHHKEKEVSSKEKLLQMRQVRHKPLATEEKPQPQVPTATIKIPKSVVENSNKETFLKTFQSCTEKLHEKVPPVAKDSLIKTLDQKLVSLQQRCTIQPKFEKKVNFELSASYPAGFTVSKVESGLKRKIEDNQEQDKRPSLEITLINPSPPPASTPVTPQTPKTGEKPAAKRPPPATIPLERIKKSMGLKSAISIIPKLPDKCDNIGALDLTKHKPELTNGVKPQTSINNLQILSKVASERPTLTNNKTVQINNKIPNLPALNAMKIPKLNEIKFRTMQTQIRNIRPSQNQNIRNIPNPSLLIKQQNQNRLNSFNVEKTIVNETKPVVPRPSALAVDSKICEKNEISV